MIKKTNFCKQGIHQYKSAGVGLRRCKKCLKWTDPIGADENKQLWREWLEGTTK